VKNNQFQQISANIYELSLLQCKCNASALQKHCRCTAIV